MYGFHDSFEKECIALNGFTDDDRDDDNDDSDDESYPYGLMSAFHRLLLDSLIFCGKRARKH